MNKIQTILDEIYEENIGYIQKNSYVPGTISVYYSEFQSDAANMYVSSLQKNFKKYLPNVTVESHMVKHEHINFLKSQLEGDHSNGIIIMNPK